MATGAFGACALVVGHVGVSDSLGERLWEREGGGCCEQCCYESVGEHFVWSVETSKIVAGMC